MSVSGVGINVAAPNLASGQSPAQVQPSIEQGSVKAAQSNVQEQSPLSELLKGFGENLQRAESDAPSSQLSTHNQNELLLDNSNALIDNSTDIAAPAASSPGKPGENGNETLAKAFDRSINMAAATLVVSGVSDTMRQLIRQQ